MDKKKRTERKVSINNDQNSEKNGIEKKTRNTAEKNPKFTRSQL